MDIKVCSNEYIPNDCKYAFAIDGKVYVSEALFSVLPNEQAFYEASQNVKLVPLKSVADIEFIALNMPEAFYRTIPSPTDIN